MHVVRNLNIKYEVYSDFVPHASVWTRLYYDVRRTDHCPEIPEILKSVLKCPEIHKLS